MIKGKSKSDGFFPCRICGKENPNKANLNSHLVSHFKDQILAKHPPIVGEKNIHTCSVNGCKKSFASSNIYNTKHNYLMHVGTVHKFFQEHLEEVVRRHKEGAKKVVKPSLGTKRKASSPQTKTPAPKKQKDEEPVAGTSGNQRGKKNSASSPRINLIRIRARKCQLCPTGFPNFSELTRHLAVSHFR